MRNKIGKGPGERDEVVKEETGRLAKRPDYAEEEGESAASGWRGR